MKWTRRGKGTTWRGNLPRAAALVCSFLSKLHMPSECWLFTKRGQVFFSSAPWREPRNCNVGTFFHNFYAWPGCWPCGEFIRPQLVCCVLWLATARNDNYACFNNGIMEPCKSKTYTSFVPSLPASTLFTPPRAWRQVIQVLFANTHIPRANRAKVKESFEQPHSLSEWQRRGQYHAMALPYSFVAAVALFRRTLRHVENLNAEHINKYQTSNDNLYGQLLCMYVCNAM